MTLAHTAPPPGVIKMPPIEGSPAPPVLGPADHGRRMTLADFGPIHVREGHHYELSRGVIEVHDFPDFHHACQVGEARDQFTFFRFAHPAVRCFAVGAFECKMLIPETESERHPDLSIYLTAPPPGPQPWPNWTADIVIEVVSASSIRRDYVDKAEDYWAAGVKEYWIVDAVRGQLQVHRRGQAGWETVVVRRDGICRTDLLPGFELACGPILDAAENA